MKSKISAEDLVIFETGVRYQMYHALGLILLGLLAMHPNLNISPLPFIFFVFGIPKTKKINGSGDILRFGCIANKPRSIKPSAWYI